MIKFKFKDFIFFLANKSVRDLVRRLVTRDTTRRLGCMKRGAKDVMDHRFFDNVDWNQVYSRQLPAPICPVLASDIDTSYFLDYSEEDKDKRDNGIQVDKHNLLLFEGF